MVPAITRTPRLGGHIMPTKPAATLENGVHHTEVRVRFGDTDPYGIVYFVSYFRYCHRAIEEFLRACGLPPEETFKNVEEGFGLPIVEAWGRFRRPSRLRGSAAHRDPHPGVPDQGHACSASSSTRKPAGTSWPKAPPPWWPSAADWKARELPERIKDALSQGEIKPDFKRKI